MNSTNELILIKVSMDFKYQGTKVELTVAQKLNQSTFRHRGVIDRGALLGPFLGKQKGTIKTIEALQ